MNSASYLRPLVALLLLLLCACSGGAGTPPDDGGQQQPDTEIPVDAATFGGTTLRQPSGKPSGVRLFWDPIAGNVSGYHLYKSESAVTGDVRDRPDLLLEVGGSTTIPQPVDLEQTIQVDDFFAAVVGDDWFYYLTTLDPDGDESLPSFPFRIVIADFSITGLGATSVAVGESFSINGDNFGIFDEGEDLVRVAGVVWESGVGFNPTMIEAPIISWQDNQVVAELPLGATSGTVDLTVGGVSQLTMQSLTNSDPYITDLIPIAADILTQVQAIGNNFGGGADASHRIVFSGEELDPAAHSQYTDDLIIFTPPNLREFTEHTVTCRVDATDSNVGFCTLLNAPPLAMLEASPTVAVAPATITFDPLGTLDPEGAALTLEYDYEDDGVFDDVKTDLTTVSHLYVFPGTYSCRLRVTDADGGVGQTSVPVIVNEFVVTLHDEGSPPAGAYYQSQDEIVITYSISGGQPPYEITWRQSKAGVPPEVVAVTNHDLPGVYSLTWQIDTAHPRLPGERKFDVGVWRLLGSPVDQLPDNDPDLPFVWPRDGLGGPGEYAIFRYDVGVVQDGIGDPTGGASNMMMAELIKLGYRATLYSSSSLSIDTIGPHHALVWAADGPHGTLAPYEWLEPTDLAVMKAFVDRGSSLIIVGPPAIDFAGQPFEDPIFNLSYQPFQSTNADAAGNGPALELQGYTAVNDHVVETAQYAGPWGNNFLLPFIDGSSDQMVRTVTGNTFRLAGSRPGPAGGNTYVGMFVFPMITSVTPAGATPAMLLDNIVAGTIQRQ